MGFSSSIQYSFTKIDYAYEKFSDFSNVAYIRKAVTSIYGKEIKCKNQLITCLPCSLKLSTTITRYSLGNTAIQGCL